MILNIQNGYIVDKIKVLLFWLNTFTGKFIFILKNCYYELIGEVSIVIHYLLKSSNFNKKVVISSNFKKHSS